jgi:chromosomal replication initiation ATPase DnaA
MSQQLTLPFMYHTSYDPADFIVGPANGEAYGFLKRWPDWPSQSLCIVGGATSGKTHLLAVYQSIIPTALKLSVDTLSIEELPDVFGRAAVILDDADTIQDETLLLHLINTVREGKGTLLMTGKTVPSLWGYTLPDLVSRLKGIPCPKLMSPDPFLLRDLMLKLFSDRQMSIDHSIIEMIAARMKPNFSIAHKIVEALDEKAAQLKKPINRSFIRDLFLERDDLFSEK